MSPCFSVCDSKASFGCGILRLGVPPSSPTHSFSFVTAIVGTVCKLCSPFNLNHVSVRALHPLRRVQVIKPCARKLHPDSNLRSFAPSSFPSRPCPPICRSLSLCVNVSFGSSLSHIHTKVCFLSNVSVFFPKLPVPSACRIRSLTSEAVAAGVKNEHLQDRTLCKFKFAFSLRS